MLEGQERTRGLLLRPGFQPRAYLSLATFRRAEYDGGILPGLWNLDFQTTLWL